MNVALPAIIVFLLLIPGLIYLRVRPLDTGKRQPPPAPVPFFDRMGNCRHRGGAS